MATIKSFTDLSQSKVLAKILRLESADMHWAKDFDGSWFVDLAEYTSVKIPKYVDKVEEHLLPCWSLAALFSLIKDKCGYFESVYLKRTTDGRANPLEDVYRLSTDVYDVYKKEALDACYEMILKLHEMKML